MIVCVCLYASGVSQKFSDISKTGHVFFSKVPGQESGSREDSVWISGEGDRQ